MLKSSSDNRTIKETGFTGPSVFLSVNVRGPVYFAVSVILKAHSLWIRVGFLPSKTCFFRTKWKKLDKTCFVQFLPSKTVQNRPKLDETMDSLVKMVILLNYISTGQGLSTKPLLIIMLLKYPIAQTLIAQAMGHFSFAEMPSSN